MPDPIPFVPPNARADYDEDDGRDHNGSTVPYRFDSPREPTRAPSDILSNIPKPYDPSMEEQTGCGECD